MAPKAVVDPWRLNADGTLDPFAENIDWNMPDLPDPDEPFSTGDPVIEPITNLDPEIVTVPTSASEPVVPVELLDPEGPETTELDDGTQLTLEKERGQWKGVVSSSTGGNPQVYWGKTKNELIFNVLKAQANATKKIREQNAKLKFNSAPPKSAVAQQPAVSPRSRQLTADDIFEIKTQLESDPALALDNLFQKKTGLNIEQLVALAQQGAAKGEYASNQLTAESVNKTFLQNNPDYYPDPDFTNFSLLIKWLAKFKLGETVPRGQETTVFDKLVSSGNYTVENLEEAFADLSSDGLLIAAPRLPITPPPVAVPTEPAPAPRPNSRIVKVETHPRAALGIRQGDVTPVAAPATPNAPSVEDLNDLSDEEISRLFAGIRRLRAVQGRRSN